MSKKSPPRRNIERIRRLLGEWPQDPDAESADVRWARRVITGGDAAPPGEALRPEVAYAVVEQLVDEEASERLGLLARTEHRLVSKAARTALHRLRSKKLAVDVPSQTGTRPTGTGQQVQQRLKSLATIYDALWERLVWVAQDGPSGVAVHHARLSAMYGLVDLQTGETSRRQYRSAARELMSEVNGEMVPGEDALWLIQDAVRLRLALGRSLPAGYTRASQALGPELPGLHPALALPAGDVPTPALTGIYDIPELAAWGPDVETLRRVALQLDQVATSRLVLDENQRQQQTSAVLARAAAEYFTAERCAGARRVLLDTAHLLSIRGRGRDAVLVRRAADVFDASPEQVAESPLAFRFFEHRLRVPKAEESEAHPAPPTDRSGGIIIPGKEV
jgi:hypothetical protein